MYNNYDNEVDITSVDIVIIAGIVIGFLAISLCTFTLLSALVLQFIG